MTLADGSMRIGDPADAAASLRITVTIPFGL